jgi:hypothetical protein
MKPFPSVTLEFEGKSYEVSPENVWGLIGTIENVISRGKLALRLADQDPPETKIAEAYAAALSYAGAGNIEPRQVMIGATLEDSVNYGMTLFNVLSLASQPEGVEVAEPESSGEESESSGEAQAES